MLRRRRNSSLKLGVEKRVAYAPRGEVSETEFRPGFGSGTLDFGFSWCGSGILYTGMARSSQMNPRYFLCCFAGIIFMTACSTARREPFLGQGMTVENEIRHNGVVSTLEMDHITSSTDSISSFQATFTIKNTTSSPISFTFPNSQQYDFLIQDDTGQELWKWSEGRFFAMLIIERKLAEEPWVFRERIPAVDRDGHSLPNGPYTLRARLMGRPVIENNLSFRID